MHIWRQPLRINSSERYFLDLNGLVFPTDPRATALRWLYGDSLTGFDIIAPDGSGLVISNKTNVSGVLSCGISGGLSTGYVNIKFVFSTSERSGCQSVRLQLNPPCVANIDPDDGLFIQGGVLVADGVITTDSSVWG